jgi:hypothetical protein
MYAPVIKYHHPLSPLYVTMAFLFLFIYLLLLLLLFIFIFILLFFLFYFYLFFFVVVHRGSHLCAAGCATYGLRSFFVVSWVPPLSPKKRVRTPLPRPCKGKGRAVLPPVNTTTSAAKGIGGWGLGACV